MSLLAVAEQTRGSESIRGSLCAGPASPLGRNCDILVGIIARIIFYRIVRSLGRGRGSKGMFSLDVQPDYERMNYLQDWPAGLEQSLLVRTADFEE